MRRVLLLLLLSSCAADRVQDQYALRDAVRQLKPLPACDRPVETFEHMPPRGHRSVASLSATCSPGSPRVCEQALIKRACELHADALVFETRAGTGGQWQESAFTLKTMNAHALQWTD